MGKTMYHHGKRVQELLKIQERQRLKGINRSSRKTNTVAC